jgi:phosphopantetheine adenylyltransferase
MSTLHKLSRLAYLVQAKKLTRDARTEVLLIVNELVAAEAGRQLANLQRRADVAAAAVDERERVRAAVERLHRACGRTLTQAEAVGFLAQRLRMPPHRVRKRLSELAVSERCARP